MSYFLNEGGSASSLSSKFYMKLLLFFAFLNGIYARVIGNISEFGWTDAFWGTFGISIIVFCAMYVAIHLVNDVEEEALKRIIGANMIAMLILIAAPVSALAWIGLTLLSLYVLFFLQKYPGARRMAMTLLAICFSMIWARLLSKFFMGYILRIDTLLVSFATGTRSSDNLIFAADGKTVLQVLEACSSFSNLSLAFLSWIAARSYYGTQGIRKTVLYLALLCSSIISVNTIRIGIIALNPRLYDLAHGAVGANLANAMITVIIGAISIHGARKNEI